MCAFSLRSGVPIGNIFTHLITLEIGEDEEGCGQSYKQFTLVIY